MKNRSKTDIIASILEVIKEGGSKRGKIMYGAYLSYTQLNEYLALLLEMGLIINDGNKEGFTSPSFKITDKGRHYLNIHNQIKEMITLVESS
ncbi:MAG: winged helix-turn-helix domain-containing protein [Nitrososphaeraceae archaeon]|jgi:predicted transcriptional regulator